MVGIAQLDPCEGDIVRKSLNCPIMNAAADVK